MKGKIIQIMGPVIDVCFDGYLPKNNEVICAKDNDGKEHLLEVAAVIGEFKVRTINMKDNGTLQIGLDCTATGKPYKELFPDLTISYTEPGMSEDFKKYVDTYLDGLKQNSDGHCRVPVDIKIPEFIKHLPLDSSFSNKLFINCDQIAFHDSFPKMKLVGRGVTDYINVMDDFCFINNHALDASCTIIKYKLIKKRKTKNGKRKILPVYIRRYLFKNLIIKDFEVPNLLTEDPKENRNSWDVNVKFSYS